MMTPCLLLMLAVPAADPEALAARAGVQPVQDEEQQADPVIELGRRYCERFWGDATAEIWEAFSPELRAAFGDKPETLATFRAQVLAQLGKQVELVEETSERRTLRGESGAREIRLFHRFARFENSPELFDVHWAFDEKDRVVTFSIRPKLVEAPSSHLDYQTKTELRLPFDDEWTVFWGGRAVAQNYHAATADQRFAYDLLVLKDGSSFAGDPRRNESYHCFGRRVLAPGAGVVVSMANDVEDNVPGKMNPRQAMGNHVILDHGNGEFSFLAHFKQGSVAVAKGDRVQAGAFLGLAGNSGNSSEAHLHYHLQTTAEFMKGEGLPAQFRSYLADGKPVERGEPVKGQRVRPAAGAGTEPTEPTDPTDNDGG